MFPLTIANANADESNCDAVEKLWQIFCCSIWKAIFKKGTTTTTIEITKITKLYILVAHICVSIFCFFSLFIYFYCWFSTVFLYSCLLNVYLMPVSLTLLKWLCTLQRALNAYWWMTMRWWILCALLCQKKKKKNDPKENRSNVGGDKCIVDWRHTFAHRNVYF